MGCCCSTDKTCPADVGSSTPLNDEIYVALHDFQAIGEQDLTIAKDERLLVIDKSQKEWIKVENIETGEQGCVPRNYVAPEDSLEAKPWFFGKLSRWEAQDKLCNQLDGTYLIRLTDKIPNGFCLSVKTMAEDGDFEIKHYVIEVDPVYSKYRFSDGKHSFKSLDELLYATEWLTEPCIKPKPPLYTLSSSSDEPWEIVRSRIRLDRRLGKGNSGVVSYGLCDGSIPVAVKQLVDVSSQEEFYAEALNMRQLRHPKLVSLYGVCTIGKPFYLVQEYMNKGDLLTLLTRDKGRTLNMAALLSIASQVAEGMEYLESQKFVHRDLAARNILITGDNEAKIGDFGLSRLLKSEQYVAAKSKIAFKWSDPLAFESGIFTIKSDVWSYGILLMEVFSYGITPYSELKNTTYLLQRLLGGYRMTQPPHVPDDIYQMARECWSQYPEERPSFSELRLRCTAKATRGAEKPLNTMAGLSLNYEDVVIH